MRLPLEVQAVIFRRKPSLEFLILRRVPEKGGFWQNLSGGVEEGESLLDTLKRELKEEVDKRATDKTNSGRCIFLRMVPRATENKRVGFCCRSRTKHRNKAVRRA